MTDPQSTLSTAIEGAPQLPPIPRPITPRARRRSWAEAPVRAWIVMTIVVALITAYFTATRVQTALADKWLVTNGTNITARIISVNEGTVKKHWPRNESATVVFEFTLRGQKYTINERLPARANAYIGAGDDFPIKVDPADPMRWTEETEFKGWARELTALILLAPLLVLLVVVVLLRRRTMLKTWQSAPLAAGEVVEVRHTATAPMSRLVRFTLRDSGDRRVWTLLMPTGSGVPAAGETVWLLCPENRPNRAAAAKLYV